MNKFFTMIAVIGFSGLAQAGSNEVRFTCVNAQTNKLAEIAHRIGFDDITLYLTVYGDGQSKASLLNLDYVHSYKQIMDPNFSDVAIIELAKLEIGSKGKLVAKKVVKANIARTNESDTVAQSLTLIYDNESTETLSQCSKDTPPIF